MTADDPEGMPGDQLMREAAQWFARMRGPDAEASREEFEAWLRRGALHRGAYNRAAEIFALGKTLGRGQRGDEGDRRPAAESGLAGPRYSPLRRRRAAAMLATGVVVLALLLLLAPLLASPEAGLRPHAHQSGPDEQIETLLLVAQAGREKQFRLTDGSAVSLDGGAALLVRFSATARDLELARGRARFAVAREPRPFVVHAGGGSVTARGTVFDVQVERGRRVIVRLIEGVVDVALPAPVAPGTQRSSARLQPGSQLSFAASPAERPPVIGGRIASGPQSVQVTEFAAVSLADLVETANRTAARPLRLADPRLARLRVSGRFRTDDTALLADRLALLFNLEIEDQDPALLLLRPRKDFISSAAP